MQTLGAKLRTERLKQNRPLAAIASDTCISARYLEAIEADDLKALPGGVFSRSFIKQYCEALGIDYHSMEQEISRVLPIEEEDPLPALSVAYEPVRTLKPKRSINTSVLVGLFVAAVVGSSGFYAWWQKMQHAT